MASYGSKGQKTVPVFYAYVHEKQNQGDGLYFLPITTDPLYALYAQSFTPQTLPLLITTLLSTSVSFLSFFLFCHIPFPTSSPWAVCPLSMYEYVSILLGSFVYALASTYKRNNVVFVFSD